MAQTELAILVRLRDEASAAFDRMSTHMQKVGVAAGVVGAGISGFLGTAVQAAGEMQQMRIGFETMLGSAKDADIFIRDLVEFARKTPFEMKDLQKSSSQLLAFGFTAQEVIPNLTALGNIASGVGMEKLPNLTLAFGQVKAATKLTGMELRQFTEAGVPLLDTLAKQMGKTASEIQDMVSKGKIGFNDVQQALQSLSGEGGKFNNLMENQSKSMLGSISNLKDSWNALLVVIGNQVLPQLTGLVTQITGVVGKVGDWAKANPELAQTIVLATGAVGAMLIAVPALAAAIAAIASPVGATIAAFSALVASAVVVYRHFDIVKERAMSLMAQIDKKTGLVSQLKAAYDQIWTAIKTQLVPAFNQWLEAMRPYMPLLEEFGKLLATGMILGLKIIVEVLKDIILLFISWSTKMIELQTAVAKYMTPAINVIKTVLNELRQVIDSIIQRFNDMVEAAKRAFNAARDAASTASRIGAAVTTMGISEVIRAVPHAEGGIVTSPHVGLVGEAGPEAIIPLDRFGGLGNRINVTITGNTISNQLDLRDVADKVGQSIMDRLSLNGRLAL